MRQLAAPHPLKARPLATSPTRGEGFIFLFFSVIFLLLAGCATSSKMTPHRLSVGQDNRYFTLHGVIGFVKRKQAEHANLVWQQKGRHFDMSLSGPLGLGEMTLQGDTRQALIHYRGKTYQGDPTLLMKKFTGWTLPVGYLPYWVLGVPAKGAHFKQVLLKDGHIASLDQAGWHIDYSDYELFNGVMLAQKIVLSHQDVTITVIIHDFMR